MSISSNPDINALISLLDEPNDSNYVFIREKILSFGIEIKNKLEVIYNKSNDEIVRNRLKSIINEIILFDIRHKLSLWYYDDKNKLYDGVLLLSEFNENEYNKLDFVRQLTEIQRNIWLELNKNLTPLEKIKVFNIIFFEKYNFTVLQTDEFYPEHILLNEVLKNRVGTPLSIGILYSIIAQRLEMPVFGFVLFKRFYLAYLNKKGYDYISFIKENEPIFYINPKLNGVTFDHKIIEYQLTKNNIEHNPIYFQSSKNIKILNLFTKNLIQAYVEKNDIYRAESLAYIESYIHNENTRKNISRLQYLNKKFKEKY